MDIGAVTRRRAELADKINRGSLLWKPRKGTHAVRILPLKENIDNPFIELWWHWGVGKESILCLSKNFSEKCPVCEFATTLWNSEDKEDKEVAKKLFSKIRFYVPIAVRGLEVDGPRYWGLAQGVYDQLTTALEDPQCGDFTDIANGRDIDVTYQTPEQTRTTYGKVSVTVSFANSPLHQDATVVEKLLNEQKSIFELYPRKTYDEAASAVMAWANPGEDSTEQEQEKEIVSTRQEDNPTTEEDSTVKDSATSADVDDIMNEIDNMLA